MRPNTRTRRGAGGCFAEAQYEIHASESEIAKDLQQLYQCPASQLSSLLLPDSEPDSKVAVRSKRKRPTSGKESDYLDAVLGLATLVSELETSPTDHRLKGSISKNAKSEPTPKVKQQPKPSPPVKTKPKPAPTVQRKQPAVSLSSAASYFSYYAYPPYYGNYMMPVDKAQQPALALMPGFPMNAISTGIPGMYPHPFNMLYQQGVYGKQQWPAAQRTPLQPTASPDETKGKRAARHVAIALLIREEEQKRKETAKGSRLI